MTPQDTMRLALEALEYASTGNRRPEIIGPAIEALRSALAQQPDADPNAPWMTEAHHLCSDHDIPHGNLTERIRALRDKLEQQGEQQPDYERGWKEGYKHGAWSAAPAAQPLSDEWIRERCTQTWVLEAVTEWVRLVEAAHGIGAGK